MMLPPPALAHVGDHGLARHVQAADVHPHRLVPLVGGRLGERRTGRRHRVVHEHVDAAEARRRWWRRARSMSSATPMSQRTASAVPPAASMRATVSWIVPGSPSGCVSTVRAAQTTVAPVAASPSARPLPMPRERARDDDDPAGEVGRVAGRRTRPRIHGRGRYLPAGYRCSAIVRFRYDPRRTRTPKPARPDRPGAADRRGPGRGRVDPDRVGGGDRHGPVGDLALGTGRGQPTGRHSGADPAACGYEPDLRAAPDRRRRRPRPDPWGRDDTEGTPGVEHQRRADGRPRTVSEPRPAPLDPERLFAVLRGHRVDYVLIGGLAAVLHGSALVTNDADICPDRDPRTWSDSPPRCTISTALRTPTEPDGLPFACDAEFLARSRC